MSANPLSAKFLLGIALLSVLSAPVHAGTFNTEAEDGIDLYNHEDYTSALKSFEAARLSDPENADVLYNLANTHYKLGDYKNAVKTLTAAESAFNDSAMKQKTLYNRGNAYYRMGDVDRAIKFYKKALELDPTDVDSKFNLEYARKQQKRAKQSGAPVPGDKNKEQQPSRGGLNPSPPDDSEHSDGDPKEPEDSSNPDAAAPDQTNETETKQETPEGDKKTSEDNQPADGDATKKQQMAKAVHEITSMNKAEADRWLNSLNEDLKKISRRQLQGKMKDLFVEGGKDW